MDKSTINGPFSIAFCMITRPGKPLATRIGCIGGYIEVVAMGEGYTKREWGWWGYEFYGCSISYTQDGTWIFDLRYYLYDLYVKKKWYGIFLGLAQLWHEKWTGDNHNGITTGHHQVRWNRMTVFPPLYLTTLLRSRKFCFDQIMLDPFGLLGVAGIIDSQPVDHSRNFPTFSTSKFVFPMIVTMLGQCSEKTWTFNLWDSPFYWSNTPF